MFNSPGSRNFIAVVALLLFVMFIYEVPEYGTSDPYHSLDVVLMGHNGILSNRTAGIILIFVFGIFTAYTIYATTHETNCSY